MPTNEPVSLAVHTEETRPMHVVRGAGRLAVRIRGGRESELNLSSRCGT